MSRKYLTEYVSGDPVADIFMVARSQLRTASNGSFYIDLELADKSGKMPAKLWKATRRIFESFSPEDFVQIRGLIETYRDQRQIRIDTIVRVDDAAVNVSDFLPTTEKEIEAMLKQITDAIELIGSEPLRGLLQAFFGDEEFRTRFSTAPAAVKYHHAHIGGLLEHTASMLEIGLRLLEIRSELDRDLLIAGIILHDAGKIEEFSYQRAFRYTDRGKLVGHLVIGANMIRERAGSIPDFPQDLLDLLLHLVLSHHGEYEYGSPRLPLTVEALAVHHIDNLDAKINAFAQIKKSSPDPDATWSEYSRMFERDIYIGGGTGLKT